MIDEQQLQNNVGERLGSQSIFLIGQAWHLMAKRANRELAQRGFSLQVEQLPILFVSYFAADNLSQQDIANTLQKDKSGIQRSLRTLERDGYLRVVADEVDRRKNIIRLTPAGRMVVEQAIEAMEVLDQQVMNQLPETQKLAFLTTMRRVIDLLKD